MVLCFMYCTELAFVREVTTKVDVFSFGVIVMELVTKTRPTEAGVEDGTPLTLRQLVDGALARKPCRLLPIMAPFLASTTARAEEEGIVVQELLRLALSCSSTEPRDRPEMSEVLSSLLKLQASNRISDVV